MPVTSKELESLFFFKGLSASDLARLSDLMEKRQVCEGELLTRRDDLAQTFYVILSGNFMIFFEDNRAFTIHERGQVIGISTALQSKTYKGTTVALTDGQVLMAKGDDLLELLQANAELGEHLMAHMTELAIGRKNFNGKLPKAA